MSLESMFPGAKLRKDTPEDEGTGQRATPGPLDLDSGVVYLEPPKRDKDDESDD